MKKILLGLVSLSAFASAHLPLDLSFEESRNLYQEFIKTQKNNKSDNYNLMFGVFAAYNTEMELAVNSGERLSLWIKKINEKRPNNPLRLTSRGTQRGIPIDRPSRYSPKIVADRLTALRTKMPQSMQDVLYNGTIITSTFSVDEETFILNARRASGIYQTATRWNMMSKWLEALKRRKARDIRGYYTLKNTENLDHKLKNIMSLDQEERDTLINALVGICINAMGRVDKSCEKSLKDPRNWSQLVDAKNRFMPRAQMVWDSYFKINNPRTDVEWTPSGQNVMKVVFKNIKDPEIANWLKDNVEDEFKLDKENFVMELNYIKGSSGTAYLEFKPGVTPHVSGGNKIVMDSNTDIQEYGVRWTIRHEFGHIMRLPDCYTEFYDEEEKVMVNYQLDVTDLMCSRAGLMNERIYEELRQKYMK